jgi:hypothetical protein
MHGGVDVLLIWYIIRVIVMPKIGSPRDLFESHLALAIEARFLPPRIGGVLVASTTFRAMATPAWHAATATTTGARVPATTTITGRRVNR